MSVLISIKSFYRNGYQIGNLCTNVIIGDHHKRVRATVTDNNKKYYRNKNRGEGMVMILESKRSKIKTIVPDSKNDSLRYSERTYKLLQSQRK